MVYKLERSNTFRKAYKSLVKKHIDVDSLLEPVVGILIKGEKLPAKYKDHPLRNDMRGYRECHLDETDNMLLMYQYKIDEENGILTLENIGTHDDLYRRYKKNRH